MDANGHECAPASRPLRVLCGGSSGLLGRALTRHLRAEGHTVIRLVRREAAAPDELRWAPGEEPLDAACLEGVDAVINLGGASIAGGRWTEKRRAAIRGSRLAATHALAGAVAAAGGRAVLLSASAVGYYGDSGATPVDERAGVGEGFLAGICRDWEAALEPARAAGARVVAFRLGLVLAPDGGALARLLPPFRLGLGGPLGSGRQGMPWIWIGDAVRAFAEALADARYSGPVNLVAPGRVDNAAFAAALGRVLGRPARLRAPAVALRLALGRLADEALLAGQFVRPAVLESLGFRWKHPDLDSALRVCV